MFQPQTYDALISGLKNVKNFQQVLDQINLFKEKNLSYLDNAEKEIKKSTRH